MNHIKNSLGFTLIESLIAMLVLSIGILALNTMQISSIKGNATASKLTIADTVATDCYEHILNLPYTHTALDPTGNPHFINDLPDPKPQLPSTISRVSWEVTEWIHPDLLDNDGDGEVDESDEWNIKGVRLTVDYVDKHTKDFTVIFIKTELYQ